VLEALSVVFILAVSIGAVALVVVAVRRNFRLAKTREEAEAAHGDGSPSPGWYPDPEQPDTQRYWDGREWTQQRAPKPIISPQRLRSIGAAVLVILGILYFTGHLDHLLYPVGLNYNECGKNGFGSVYCGEELTEYEERIKGFSP